MKLIVTSCVEEKCEPACGNVCGEKCEIACELMCEGQCGWQSDDDDGIDVSVTDNDSHTNNDGTIIIVV